MEQGFEDVSATTTVQVHQQSLTFDALARQRRQHVGERGLRLTEVPRSRRRLVVTMAFAAEPQDHQRRRAQVEAEAMGPDPRSSRDKNENRPRSGPPAIWQPDTIRKFEAYSVQCSASHAVAEGTGWLPKPVIQVDVQYLGCDDTCCLDTTAMDPSTRSVLSWVLGRAVLHEVSS